MRWLLFLYLKSQEKENKIKLSRRTMNRSSRPVKAMVLAEKNLHPGGLENVSAHTPGECLPLRSPKFGVLCSFGGSGSGLTDSNNISHNDTNDK